MEAATMADDFLSNGNIEAQRVKLQMGDRCAADGEGWRGAALSKHHIASAVRMPSTWLSSLRTRSAKLPTQEAMLERSVPTLLIWDLAR